MKKFLVVLTALALPCFLVRAQEADDTGTGVGLSIIPRIDLSPEFYDGKGDFTLGNSSLYSLFEGNLSDSFSFSVANHWLAFYGLDPIFDDTRTLYDNTFKRYCNWLDWANLSWKLGKWTVTLGKDIVTTGGLEFDDYDFDVHPTLSSSLWNNFDCYQWGGKVSWNILEDQEVSLQASLSPTVEKVFDKAALNFSLAYRGSFQEGLESLWSATAVGKPDGSFFSIVAIGDRIEMGSCSLGVDIFYIDNSESFLDGATFMPSLTIPLGDKFELFAKAGYERRSLEGIDDNFFGGAVLNWYPLKDSQSLRIHAAASYVKDAALTCVSLGATWRFDFSLVK